MSLLAMGLAPQGGPDGVGFAMRDGPLVCQCVVLWSALDALGGLSGEATRAERLSAFDEHREDIELAASVKYQAIGRPSVLTIEIADIRAILR